MSTARNENPQHPPVLGDKRDTVIQKAIDGGLTWKIETQFDRQVVKIELPNGPRGKRPIYISAELANIYSTLNFSSVVALGNYEAAWDHASGLIEAQVDSDRGLGIRMLSRIPEATVVRPTQNALFEFDEDDALEDGGGRRPDLGEHWMVKLTDPHSPISIEISPAGPTIAALGGRSISWRNRPSSRPTLKIRGFTESNHDGALKRLVDISAAFFFELDLKRNIPLRLSRARLDDGANRTRFRRSDAPLTVPAKKYPNDAVSLYTYGRQAIGMPLLQFLAYYQCIEYFFPQYWNAEIIGRARRMINDPRFDPDQDSDIGRLLNVSSGRGRPGASEREQLRTTVDACVGVDELQAFLDEDDARREALTAKTRLRGVTPLTPKDRNNKLTHQVATHLYDLRCRVVHAKEDGGDAAAQEVLLPFSSEADRIGPDVDLARFVAQKVIIAGRRGSQW